MDVVIDTSAIRASGAEGSALKSLNSYLKKTRSSLLIPNVVLEELCAQRKVAIEKAARDLASAQKDLKRFFPDLDVQPPNINIKTAISLHRRRLLTLAIRFAS